MIDFLFFFTGYFYLTFTLSKIAEKEEMDSDGIGGFLLLFPPLYLLYITKRFKIMALISVLSYGICNALILNGFPFYQSLLIFLFPLILSFVFILHNLKADQKLNLANFFPPIIGSFFLLGYLAFIYKRDKILEKKYFAEKKTSIFDENDFYNKNKTNSEFKSLNKNLFKSFEKLDYKKVNNEIHFGTN